MSDNDNSLFLLNPLGDLNALIKAAQTKQASRLLLLTGKPVLCRIEGKLSQPMHPDRLHFRQTQCLADALLNSEQQAELDKAGAVEIDYTPDAANRQNSTTMQESFPMNIFYGDGAHNVVVFLMKTR